MEFTKENAVVLAISLCGFSDSKKRQIIEEFGEELSQIFDEFETTKECLLNILTGEEVVELKEKVSRRAISEWYKQNSLQGIKIIAINSEAYPTLLSEIDNPPLVLYAKGDTSILGEKCVAVVGTRKASRYGREVTRSFCAKLAANSLVVVSGLARGIDTEAHTAALAVGGKTVAVVASGLDITYPSENLELSNAIIDGGGAIISEYPIGTRALPFRFPERNRIIAGLCNATLVTEAGVKSGAMITAYSAIDCNREVFAVPCNVSEERGSGCNEFIKKYYGAFTISADDILEFFNITYVKKDDKKPQEFIGNKKIILDGLERDELHFDELQQLTGQSVAELSAELLEMELLGAIKKLAGNFYGK